MLHAPQSLAMAEYWGKITVNFFLISGCTHTFLLVLKIFDGGEVVLYEFALVGHLVGAVGGGGGNGGCALAKNGGRSRKLMFVLF